MEWADAFENVNYVAVLIAALSSFVVGGIWYAQGVFGKKWMKTVGLKKKDLEEDKSGMVRAFVGTFLLALVTAYFLSVFFYMAGGAIGGWVNGAVFGAVIGLAFATTTIGTNYLYEKKPLQLFAINAGHVTLAIAVMGGIIGGFGY